MWKLIRKRLRRGCQEGSITCANIQSKQTTVRACKRPGVRETCVKRYLSAHGIRLKSESTTQEHTHQQPPYTACISPCGSTWQCQQPLPQTRRKPGEQALQLQLGDRHPHEMGPVWESRGANQLFEAKLVSVWSGARVWHADGRVGLRLVTSFHHILAWGLLW